MTPRIPLEEHPLLFITDRHRSKDRDNRTVVRAALEGGIRWIQYREPDLDDNAFYDECLKIKETCDQVGAGLIVNSRLDIAALVRADGVQLGKNSLPVRVVKEYMGEDFLVGFSAHNLQEAVTAAWEGADYITYSPLFKLEHKESPHEPHGIKGALEVLEKLEIPVFFLGGIRLPDLAELASSIHPLRIAAVSMICAADNISAAADVALRILGPAFMRGKNI